MCVKTPLVLPGVNREKPDKRQTSTSQILIRIIGLGSATVSLTRRSPRCSDYERSRWSVVRTKICAALIPN